MKHGVEVFAIVPAAGSGQRMHSEVPKQYLPLFGKTVLEHTLMVLLNEPKISQIIVCLSVGDTRWNALGCADEDRIKTVVGGANRAESVMSGLTALTGIAQDRDWVLVHDAARPCLLPKTLTRFLDEVSQHPSGGIVAVPARDTLKIANSSCETPAIKTTLDRDSIWQAQTPQMFRYALLHKALKQAFETVEMITDEASAMERAGHLVSLMTGDTSNIKVTTADDLQMAESILQTRYNTTPRLGER